MNTFSASFQTLWFVCLSSSFVSAVTKNRASGFFTPSLESNPKAMRYYFNPCMSDGTINQEATNLFLKKDNHVESDVTIAVIDKDI